MPDRRRDIPRTDTVLADPEVARVSGTLGRSAAKDAVHEAQRRARDGEIAPGAVVAAARESLLAAPSGLRPVVNATGVVVHTNLGRAPLSPPAREALLAASGTTDVEFDLASGGRAPRGAGALAALGSAVPDAEDVHVVNNNAAALLLVATALARGREIVVSRGELVEIGDGFRIPDLLASTGAVLREVGTTNRTTVRDYADAIGADTGFVLKVHPSNFRVSGFTAAVGVADLAGLGVPVVVDIGSGLLAPDPMLPDEPDAASALRAGASLVTASGDKLLGGPQAGLLLGDADIVRRLRRHPAARALRVGKLTLAALAATVRGPEPPVYEALHADVAVLHERAHSLAAALSGRGLDARAVECVAAVGGGGAPGVTLPSAAVSLPEGLARALRMGDPPVVGRVERGRLLLDLRTVPPAEDARIVPAVLALAGTGSGDGDPPCT